MEPLIVSVTWIRLHMIIYLIQDFIEMSWTIQLGIFQTVLIVFCHLLNTIDPRIENISVHCETV